MSKSIILFPPLGFFVYIALKTRVLAAYIRVGVLIIDSVNWPMSAKCMTVGKKSTTVWRSHREGATIVVTFTKLSARVIAEA